ncbi:MAG: hypothetical protein M5U12_07040 [Verrucomicrobia bacterium]|nr:hypothetical protein [Verrucomicrobiota bacterium]
MNLNVPATDLGLYLNVVTDQWWTDMPPKGAGWDLNLWGSSGLSFYHPSQGATMRYPGVTTGNAGNWQLNADNYFGFRFVNEAGDTTHYGWGRLAVGPSSTVRTLVDYAYESEAGQPINVGAGMVPEPRHTQLLSALALGAVGLLYRRNRRNGLQQPA